MIEDSDKANEKFQFLEKLMEFEESHFRLIFWFCSLLTIPVFAYIYTIPFSLFVWLISSLLGLNDKYIDVMTKIAVFLCFFFALGTQFYLWKLYKKRKVVKDKAFT